MINFDSWFADLISNYVWYNPASMQHKPETFQKIANAVYMQYVASENFPPIQEARRHVYNKLVLVPSDKVKVKDWHTKALKDLEDEEEDEKWQPVSEEERVKRLAEWAEIIKGCSMLNSMPKPSYKELAEEGGVLPPKPAPYPCTSKEEAYIRDRHFEYIKYAYEPRTAVKRHDAISEEEFNREYDEANKFPDL